MAKEVTCPSCRRLLRIPEGVREPSLTCPGCLGEVDNLAGGAGVPGPDRSVDTEVAWDTRLVSGGLVIIAVLVGLGLLFALKLAPAEPEGRSSWPAIILIFVVFLGAVAAAIVEVLKPRNLAGQGADRLLARPPAH